MAVPGSGAQSESPPQLPQPSAAKTPADAPRPQSGRRAAGKPFERAGAMGLTVFAAASAAALLLLALLRLVHYSDYYALVGLAWPGGGGGGRMVAACDWFEGRWVWDESYPLYESEGCEFVDEGFRCGENGRRDRMYTKWRWQPAGCDLPRFDSKKLLEKSRNKRLVFVGDSIGRNQWESMLCLLSTSISNKSSIYEVNGSPITKHKGFLVYKFEPYNFTVEYYRSPFLVPQGRPPARAPKGVKTTLRLDYVDWTSKRWKDADVLVFNTGHWWNSEKTIRGGCYFQEGDKVEMEMTVDDAYQRSIRTLFEWIQKEVNRSKTQVVFRTYSPAHFRFGDWKTGGSCHLETLPDLSAAQISLEPWAQFLKPFSNMPLENSTATEVLELELLNVTQMTARRKDGHLSIFYLGPSAPALLHKQDCSHWCLPGVPDAWNELLYALIMRRESHTPKHYFNENFKNQTG